MNKKESLIQEDFNPLVDVMTGEYKEEDYSPEKIGIRSEMSPEEVPQSSSVKPIKLTTEECVSRLETLFEWYQKDTEFYYQLKVSNSPFNQLKNRVEELEQVLSFIREHVLLDGSVLRANFQWDLDIEENAEVLKEYFK